jgi:hypothetical protein
MLDPETVEAAVLAAAGEMQALANHLGLAARSTSALKFSFEADLRAFLRRALQFGETELVSVETPLGSGMFEQPTDVVVSAKSKVAQLGVELQWHPRGEDHVAFANEAMGDVLKMSVAKAINVVEQATVLLAAPGRFWRWLPGYAQERAGYELLTADRENPINSKSDFLGSGSWKFLFQNRPESLIPERIWSSLLADAEVGSPWGDVELRLFEVKGLGSVRPLLPG